MASAASGSAFALLAVFSLFVPAWASATPTSPDLRVLSSDSFGLQLELVTPAPLLDAERAPDGSTSDRVRVPGWGSTRVPGHPELPTRSLLVQIPPAGEVDVAVEEDAVHAEAESIFPGLLPEAPYELSPRSILRGVTVMRLTLHPFRWISATGGLRSVGRMLVRVRFREPLPARYGERSASQESFGPVWEESIVNWQGAAGFPEPAAAGSPRIVPAGATALRMEIRQDGMYRVTGNDLLAAGVAIAPIDPRTLRVVAADGQETAIRATLRFPNRMVRRDAVEFFAQGLANAFTDANVYWLLWDGNRGQRIATADGSVAEGSEAVISYPERLHFEENRYTWDTMPGAPRQDFWFWQGLQAPRTVTYGLTIPSPAPITAQARLRIAFRGHTTGAHRVRVFLNGANLIGDDQWTGTEEHLFDWPFDQGLLAAGANACTVELPGVGTLDQIFINWIEVDYGRTGTTVGDELRLTVPGAAVDRFAQVGGLSQPGVRVLDVTDPHRPLALSGVDVAPEGNGYRVRFGIGPGEARSFLVLADAAVRVPSQTRRWRAPLLEPAAGADYLLITPRAFLAAAQPLLTLRRDQGLRVRAVAIEDIFNTYGGGLPDPVALKRFLREAYHQWTRPAPAFVFLLGDANLDYRDFLGTGKKSRVPTHLSPTTGLSVTPDDNWFAAVDGDDDLPDLFIGRVSVGSAEAAEAAVSKIVGYERAPRPAAAEALFVADNNEAIFQDVAEGLTALLPGKVSPRRLYLADYSDFDLAKQDLRNTIGEGMLVTTYVGHGDVTGWAGERILDTTTVQLLDNAHRLTFVLALDCLNGFFAQPFYYSLGELLTNMPVTGAVATFASSGFGENGDHALLAEALLPKLFTAPRSRLGSASTQAKLQAYGRGATVDLVKMFTLLGDPATRLATPP